MFGLFTPKCPLDLYKKVWIEWRWRWLGEQLGWQTMLDAPAYSLGDVPGSDQRQLSEDDVQSMFRFIAESMHVDLSRICLIIEPEDRMRDAGAVGLYERRGHSPNPSADPEMSTIFLSDSELIDPPSTVSTLAHELAHEVLLGGELLDNESDGEWLTDLLPVFFGYGVYLSNNTIREVSWSEGGWAYHQMSQKGYLSSQMLGHALALFAWHRQEQKPDWIGHLRLDARKTCADSLRFFHKTEDALVTPERLVDQSQRRQSQVGIEIEKMSPTHRLGCLWDLNGKDSRSSQLSIAVATKLLSDKEKTIRAQAIFLLDEVNDLPEESCRALEQVMTNYAEPISGIQAILILSNNNALPDDAFDLLRERLGHSQPNVVNFAARAMGELAQKNVLPVDNPRLIMTIIEVAEKAIRVGLDELSTNLHPALIRIPDFCQVVREMCSHWSDERISELIDFTMASSAAPDLDEIHRIDE